LFHLVSSIEAYENRRNENIHKDLKSKSGNIGNNELIIQKYFNGFIQINLKT
jgi:hypothetical protein